MPRLELNSLIFRHSPVGPVEIRVLPDHVDDGENQKFTLVVSNRETYPEGKPEEYDWTDAIYLTSGQSKEAVDAFFSAALTWAVKGY